MKKDPSAAQDEWASSSGRPAPAPTGAGRRGVTPYACFLSKNCSSSVEPFSAPVEASRSIVVVTASK